jgi:putative effector of murein hydrolase
LISISFSYAASSFLAISSVFILDEAFKTSASVKGSNFTSSSTTSFSIVSGSGGINDSLLTFNSF